MPSLTGKRVDKYDMLEEVGCGGMAVVYRSRDSVLDREVAVKVLHSHLADREESRLRLRREALTVAKLRHDNILEIYDYSGPEAEESYIVTEFIHGPTLSQWINGDGFQPRPVLAAMIVHHLALALAHAHEQGVVHRDLKPENVMVRAEDGCLKLMDFGIAQILDQQQKLTLTGQLLGSPAYMAPELINGQPIDARTDLFSISILLYQLATGTLPFSGRNPHEVLNRIADAEYAPPSAVCSLVDEDLEAILARGLARDPDERYQSARSLAADLEDYLREMGVTPSDEELRAYFSEPHVYVERLDERACAALLLAADQAMQSGNTARALRLLGRTLELDPGNHRAESLLAAVRKRGRRMRQVLVAGAVIAFGGFVSAGVLLMQPDPDSRFLPEPREAAARPTAEGVVEVKSTEPTKSKPVPKNSGSQADDPAKGPAKPRSATLAGNGSRTDLRDRPGRRPGKSAAACKIRVDNLPVAQRRLYTLHAGDENVRLSRSSDTVEVEVPAKGVRVALKDGPRYEGAKYVYPGDCARGETITLVAKPKPARIRFTEYPEHFVVSCNKGCTGQFTPSDFPSLTIPPGRDRLEVDLTLRAQGHEHRKESRSLQPGRNVWRVSLKPAE